uniref:Eukaryotic translation initiation factor 3 subunit B n=1 Tax=Trichuris muris TaxID=70415 RepID=A0A5S6QXC5_TRIMR
MVSGERIDRVPKDKTRQAGTTDEDEPDFSDPEDYVDNVTDEELLGDLLSDQPVEEDIGQSIVIVDGVPKVGPDRLGKLKTIMSKIFGKFGHVLSEYYPLENDTTKGYAFVAYASKANAEEAASVLNGYKLDKSHTFTVNLFCDMEKYRNADKDWTPPEPRPYKDHGNLLAWLLNEECFDQFVIQAGSNPFTIGVYWNSLPEPSLICEKKNWSEAAIQWSPQGTYLATVHAKGIAFWGGVNFDQIVRFGHPYVGLFDIISCEQYLVTFSDPKGQGQDLSDCLKIWDTRTGDLKRVFPYMPNICKLWPYLKWSHDSKYFAFVRDDTLSIYETPSFTLLDKKSMTIEGIRDFQWSPTQNYIAYWVAERDQAPGRVALMKVPEKTDLRSKNMFNMAEAVIHWQKSGDNLCFKVDRYGRKKEEKYGDVKYTNISHHLEIFHVRGKEIPVSTLEVKDTVQAIAWEPYGTKFATIQGDLKCFIHFYSVRSDPTVVTTVKVLEQKQQVNSIYWAPTGHHVLFAGLRTPLSGTLVFVDTSGSDIVVCNQQEHTGVTDIEWDPSGRYVVTSVSIWSSTRSADCGYMIWNFQGRLLQRKPVEEFCRFSWRPRPKSLLTDAESKKVKRNLKKYTEMFEERDRLNLLKASEEVVRRRREMFDEFQQLREQRHREWLAEKDIRIQLRGCDVDDDALDSESYEIETETLLSEQTFQD